MRRGALDPRGGSDAYPDPTLVYMRLPLRVLSSAEMLIRLMHLRSFRQWWRTRRCQHVGGEHSRLINSGRQKMFWCVRCQRTWFQ